MLDDKNMKSLSQNLIQNPDNYMNSYRENVRMYIDQKEITLAEVAELADIPESSLKSFIYGNSSDGHLSMAIKLARLFKISVDELIGCGTISSETCNSLQVLRRLPASMTSFVRWSINFHEKMLSSNRVSDKAIEVMTPEIAVTGNVKLTNNFDLMDFKNLPNEIRPKIFMGIKVIGDLMEPIMFDGDIILIANDRKPFNNENVVLCSNDNLWIAKYKEEIVDGQKLVRYFSLRDSKYRPTDESFNIIGYIVKIARSIDNYE